MQVPAVCRNCGTIFPSNFNVGDGNEFIHMKGNTAEPCPNCGGVGDMIDGTFDFEQHEIKVRSAPPKTIEVLKLLQQALSEARKQESIDAVIDQIAKVSIDSAEQARNEYLSGGWRAVIAFLIALLLANCSDEYRASVGLEYGKDGFSVSAFAEVKSSSQTPSQGQPDDSGTGSAGERTSDQSNRPGRAREQRKQAPQSQIPSNKRQPEASDTKVSNEAVESEHQPERNFRQKQKAKAARRRLMKGDP